MLLSALKVLIKAYKLQSKTRLAIDINTWLYGWFRGVYPIIP
jgi:hypothetical protein